MTATHDIAALMAAIDAGDDLALSALADALEEAGDARARGVRILVEERKRPDPLERVFPINLGGWTWFRFSGSRLKTGFRSGSLPPIVWDAMADAEGWERKLFAGDEHYLEYRTLSDAVMAFAEAVADDRP